MCTCVCVVVCVCVQVPGIGLMVILGLKHMLIISPRMDHFYSFSEPFGHGLSFPFPLNFGMVTDLL